MNGKSSSVSLFNRILARTDILIGHVWPTRRAKGWFFAKYIENRPSQAALATVMPVIRTKAGFVLHGSAVDYTSDWIRVFGAHEISTEKFIRRFARPGSTMLDIGSNIGYFSFLSAVVKGTHSVAFEPNPEVVESLRKSVKANAVGDRFQIIETALGDADGQAKIVPDSTKADTGGAHMEMEAGGSVQVQRLDSMEARNGPFTDVSVVKIDVEGWELSVLRGMQEFLRRERPALAIEDLPGNYGTAGRYSGDLDEILRPLGYVEDPSWRVFDRFPANRFYVHPEKGNLSAPK